MRDSWDTWEESQAADPRRALLRNADQDAKRRRVGDALPGVNGCRGSLCEVVPLGLDYVAGVSPPVLPGSPSPGLQQNHASAPAADDDITARIVNALKHHLSTDWGNPGLPAGFVLPPPQEAAEPELSTRLLDSLRTLLPTGESAEVCRSSEEGQELFRVVQSLAPQPPAPPGSLLALPAPQAQACDADVLGGDDTEGEPIRLPAANFGAPPPLPERPPSPREEDAESDDGVPHRLPPGFGAIPEDLVEERARQREEERVLRLKATQPCRFGRRCKRRDCPNAHPEGRDIDTSLNPCAFGRRCKRKGCFYDHPEGRVIDDDPTKGMCKFGKRCSRPDCLYDHPEGRTPLTGPDPRICYFCHDPGHIASDCPRNPESWNYNREAERDRRTVVQPQEQQKAIAAPT